MYFLKKRRKERQDTSAFDALVSTPANLLLDVKLPANAEIYISTSEEVLAPEILIAVGARQIGVPPGAADLAHHIGFLEKGKTIEKDGDTLGVVSVFIRDGTGNLLKIAEG